VGPVPEAASPPQPEAVPQEDANRPAAATEVPAAAPGIEAVPSSEASPPATEAAAPGTAAPEAAAPEVAAPEVAAPGAAAPEVADVASCAAAPAEEEEPEEVLGRRLLPSTAEIPLSRIIVKCQQALEELEAGISREWEKLEAERHRLSDWEVRLGDRINTVSARYAEERAELVAGRELLREELEQARVREAAALQREKATVRREVAALEGLKAVEELKEAVADRERVARELAAEARKASAAVEAEKADLADLAAAVAKKEELLAAREAEEVVRLQELQKREEAVEEELAAGNRRIQEREAALQERESKVEGLLAEQRAGTGRLTRWVSTVNPLLEELGANPIRVSEAPSPFGAALQLLDSTARRLQDVEAGMQDLLETEGRIVAREVAEYILTSFRSHDPSIQLTPVLVGPI
jgi:DNA repair exonuclease SbcCD ATPase subunit